MENCQITAMMIQSANAEGVPKQDTKPAPEKAADELDIDALLAELEG